MLLMILCWLISIIAIVVLRDISVQSSFLSFAVVLIYPLSVVIMMVATDRNDKDNGDQTRYLPIKGITRSKYYYLTRYLDSGEFVVELKTQ